MSRRCDWLLKTIKDNKTIEMYRNVYVLGRSLLNVGLASLLLAICCVRLAARNFGNGRVVLCTWETIIASSGLQLLWEGYVFFGFFVCILYNIITIQYNLIL